MASIKCANCKETHTSVEEVRACFRQAGAAKTVVAEFAANHTGEGAPNRGAGSNRFGSKRPNIMDQRSSLFGSKPSVVDRVRVAAEVLPNVPKSRYALYRDGQWKFYVVDKPQKGRWVGYTFVKVMASDEEHKINSVGQQAEILEAIAFNVEKAASDFGHEIGACGFCNRTLTDPVSIDRGIGPICAAKAGL